MQRTNAIETDILMMKREQNSMSDSVDALKKESASRKTECGDLKQKIERLEELKMRIKKVNNMLIT